MTFWGLTWALLRLSGRCVPVAVLAFAACAVALGYQLIWIKGWIDSSVGATVHRASDGTDWMTGLLVLCLVDVVARCFGGVLLAHSGAHLSRTIHAEMLRCVVSSPVSFFDTTPRGRIMNRLSADLDSIDSKLYLLSKQSLQNGLIMFARLAVIGVQSPTVLLVGAVAGLVLLYGFRITVRASHTSRFFESVATSRVLSHVTESMDAMSSIRAYGVVERFCDHFARLADVNMRGYLTYCMCFRFLRAIAAVCGLAVVLCTLLLCVVGVGTLDRSSVGLSLSAASTIPMSLMYICVTSFSALQMVVAFERCIEYMELPAEVDEAEHKNDPSNDIVKPDGQDWPSQGKVEFDSFAASYRPQILPDVLRCVSFTVEPMQKVGVVGRTGAGKSSLALALLRVLRSSHGSIRIDGLDIAEVPLRKLRRGVTLIPQDPNLVRGSLRENLDPTNSHSDEEIWEALDQAHLKDLVSQDPKRLLLEAGEGGSNLSTGQRQLVCLARAILRRPRLLLLDEATSQMDGDTDRLIQATLREGFAHCTLITIAHRIHTVLDYDRILVMDDGRVCEFGSVAELLSNKDSVFHRMADEAGVLQSDETDSTTSL
uniref:Putative abctransporter n=2 Tax=Ixodes ricinus TaxID=34613 RepID=A0A6B0VDX7_IXORI